MDYQADMEAMVHSQGNRAAFFMNSKIFGPKITYSGNGELNLTGAVSIGNSSANFVKKKLTLLQFRDDKKYEFSRKALGLEGNFQKVNGIFVFSQKYYNSYPSIFNFHSRTSEYYGNNNLHFGQPVIRSDKGLRFI